MTQKLKNLKINAVSSISSFFKINMQQNSNLLWKGQRSKKDIPKRKKKAKNHICIKK